MKEEKLLKLFGEIFTEVPTNEIVLDAEFKEWEQYSSLTMMILIDKISTEFDVKLKILPLVKAETIGDILELIKG
ncbi:phosphopantetheine-binding protein [Bacteroides stercoris]|jgi:acyl carrier protein|uniref:Acyl carrier protein n=1 Tax=Bacteroides stercoris TaxID=46506 RepID=A0A413B3L7_BACSE|nr:phosphopantetheine-binding protein [Bacteroides stercoris]RGW32165.1 acyl carrier protein [Bacteroides stercoris]RGZ90380.1 acyl carrier protein [Bacteroides stercoris]